MGVTNDVQNLERSNANAQAGLANTESVLSLENQRRALQLEQPAINLYSGLTSGDPKAQLTAASPIIGQIQSGYNAAKQNILNTTAPGAARDFAMTQLPIQSNAATSGVIAQETAGAFDKLANIGAGLGSFSLNQGGLTENAFAGSTQAIGQLGQQQAQQKASTMGFLGSIVSGAANVATGGMSGLASKATSAAKSLGPISALPPGFSFGQLAPQV